LHVNKLYNKLINFLIRATGYNAARSMFAATERKASNVAETKQKNKNVLKDRCRGRKLV